MWLTIILFVILVASILVFIYSDNNSTRIVGINFVIAIIAIVVLIAVGCIQLNSHSTNEINLARYEELLIYRDTIDKSTDELLRYNFYNKVQKWNNEYEEYIKTRNSSFTNWFVGAHDYNNCDFIIFNLNRE